VVVQLVVVSALDGGAEVRRGAGDEDLRGVEPMAQFRLGGVALAGGVAGVQSRTALM